MGPENSSSRIVLGQWFTSSYSGSHGECVEVAGGTTGVAIRDTKNRPLGALSFDGNEWQAFLGTAHRDMR